MPPGQIRTAQHAFGPPYTATDDPTSRERYRTPGVVPFAGGTAAGIWTQTDAGVIYRRHLGADGASMGAPYEVWSGTDALPNTTSSPLTGSLGVVVLDTPIRNTTDRAIRGRLIGTNGPVGASFDVRTIPTSTPMGGLDVASNGDGTATVAWAEFDGQAFTVQERRIDEHGVSGPTRLISEPVERPENAIAINSVEVRGHGDGTASISWYEAPTSATNLNVRRVGSDGPAGPIRQITTGDSGPPRIAAHADGSITAVWDVVSTYQTSLQAAAVPVNGPVEEQTLDLVTSGVAYRARTYQYDIAATEDGWSTVVAREAPNGNVVSWRMGPSGPASPKAILEESQGGIFSSPVPRVVGDGAGEVVAMWMGYQPSSHLPTLRVARIDATNSVAGSQTLFPLADGTYPAQLLASPALSGGRVGALPIWAAWSDWTANPADDPTTTRQVYAARYPRIIAPTIHPRRMIAFGDSYSSGQGLVEESGLSYDCGTDMNKARYREDTTVLAKHSWTAADCDTRTLSQVQPRDLYRRKIAVHENRCYRHRRAYPHQLRSTFGIASEGFLFLACGGATATNMGLLQRRAQPNTRSRQRTSTGARRRSTPPFRSQDVASLISSRLGSAATMPGFVQIIDRCVYGDCLDSGFQSGAMSQINGTAYNRLAETFRKLAGRYPAASVLTFGVPSNRG